jgi:hypothetical protein
LNWKLFIQVLDQLLSQYARNQFVAQTFHIELDNQKAVHRLFSDLSDELEQRTEDINKRMVINAKVILLLRAFFH